MSSPRSVGSVGGQMPVSRQSRSLQSVMASNSNMGSALHRAVSVLGPLQMRRSSAARYDVIHRSGSLSSIRRRRAKVRKVRSASRAENQVDPQPLICTSNWSLSSFTRDNDILDAPSKDAKRRYSLYSSHSTHINESLDICDGQLGHARSELLTTRGRGLSDSVFSLRSLEPRATAFIPLQRSSTIREKVRVVQRRCVSSSAVAHQGLCKSASLPAESNTRIKGSVRILSKGPYHPFFGATSASPGMEPASDSPAHGAAPGAYIWEQVIAKHWQSLMTYLKPHQCQDLLYQYDLISWQQYRSIESSSDDKDASSHLLYALRDGPPDAVGTFIDLLSKVPGQDGLAYMLQQDLLSLSRNHATAESTASLQTVVSPQNSDSAVSTGHLSASQSWSGKAASPNGASSSSSPPASVLSSSSIIDTGNAKSGGDGRPAIYSMVSKPPKPPQSSSTSAQVTSDEGFVEQGSDEETSPPVPPHPVPLPDISLEICMSPRENLYNDIPIKSQPPPLDPPHHSHTGSNLSHNSHGTTSSSRAGPDENTPMAESAPDGIVRGYSLSEGRAYSPRGQFFAQEADVTRRSDKPTLLETSRQRDRTESLHEKRAYSPRAWSSVAGISEVTSTSSKPQQSSAKGSLSVQTQELDRLQSSLLDALETMRVESPPGVDKPTITVTPGKHIREGSMDSTDQPGRSRTESDLRHRPLPKSPEDQSPFSRGIDSDFVPPPLAADSLHRGVAPITRDSLQLENPNARRRLTPDAGRPGTDHAYDMPTTSGLNDSSMGAPPYETLSRIRGDKGPGLTVKQPPNNIANPILISPPYAEASVIAKTMNPMVKLNSGSLGAKFEQHATVTEVFPDDPPEDMLGEGNGNDETRNDDSYLDTEQPYDQGFIRAMSPSQSMQVRAPSANSLNPGMVSSVSPSSREWDGRETATPAALSTDSGGSQRPSTPGTVSLSSTDKNMRIAPSTIDDMATPLELWMMAWIAEYLQVDSDHIDVCHYVAVGLRDGSVADTTTGGKGLALVHMVFDNLNVRQYRLRRKGILQSLAMGFNMLELKVVCREINHGQSLLMSLWLPESGRDFVLRLAEEKSFVLLSAGIVLVRNLSQVVWCVDKRKQKKKKLRLSKGKSKPDPVDFEKVDVAVDKTACELWLLMEPIRDPIHHAVLTGNHLLVDTLISIGMDINGPNKDGETPLHLAAQIGHVDVTRLLTDTGAIVNAVNTVGMTPLHWACNQGNYEVASSLLRAGADVNAVEQKQNATPLHTAAVMGHPHIVQLLIDHGANVKAIDHDGHTACHLAVLFAPLDIEDDDTPDDYSDILDTLLCSGAQPTPRSHEWITPMHIAASQGQERLIQVLLHYHADVNAVDQRHWQTPLHFAAAAGKLAVVDTLANSGADLAAIDKAGLTAGDIATSPQIREYLEERLCTQHQEELARAASSNGSNASPDMLVTDV